MNNHHHHNHQQQQPPEPPPLTASGGDCGNCGAHLRGLLHNVRLRGIQRKLCTSCVLRLHPSSFCPVCFAFYDSNPPHPSKRFACSKCASFTHSLCASTPPPSPYLCPPCSAPSPASFTFFRNDASAGGGRRIDGKSAAVILCAARIASASMAKAVAVARIEAEKKAKDAASARKRAREALERVALLITKNNVNATQNNNGGGDGSAQLPGSAASFFNANKKQNVNVSQELVNNVKTETG
ncbi:hypothetical protein LWI29_015433 [Acer saccharum]|uniref:Uncharacterized protein n=1 Tax=Acer saccharum TaxID=4024 RepID=A0AA39VTH7_ACESA|nr:hypothetical protein LWI29_015433 [Acer saccharum]KAK1572643.1 hypothetical protein Q3G72_035632 [Acer saccharum]